MRYFEKICYIISAWFVGSGFYKIFVYSRHLSSLKDTKDVNVYVGSDAYNYIINSERAIAYFILALMFFIMGFCCYLVDKINQIEVQIKK